MSWGLLAASEIYISAESKKCLGTISEMIIYRLIAAATGSYVFVTFEYLSFSAFYKPK